MKGKIKSVNYNIIISVLLVVAIVISVAAVGLEMLSKDKQSVNTDNSASLPTVSSPEIVEKSALSELKSISLVPGEDFLIDDLDFDSAVYLSKAALDTVKDDGFNAVEIKLNCKGGLLYENPSFSVPLGNILPSFYSYARDKGIKVTAVIDLKALAETHIAFESDITAICAALSDNNLGANCDMLVFENCYLTDGDAAEDLLFEALKKYYLAAAKSKASLYTGFELNEAEMPDGAVTYFKKVADSGYADFITVCDPYSTEAENNNFSAYFDSKKTELGDTTDLFVKLAYYNVGSGKKDWQQTDQILQQLKALEQTTAKGFIIDGFIEFSKDTTESKTAVKKYLAEQLAEGYIVRELSVTKPTQQKFTTSDNTVLLSGASDPEFKLLLNGKELERSELGYFSADLELKDGLNTFILEHKGVLETYEITYKRTVIKSVSPAEKSSLPSQSLLLVSCVAISGSTVTATLGEYSTKLSESPIFDANGLSTGEYSDYYGSIQFPTVYDKDLSLGKITFTAKSQYGTETKSGGNIVIICEERPESTPSSSEQPSSSSSNPSSTPSSSASSGTTSSGTSSNAPTGGSAWTMPSNGKYVDVGNTYIAEVVDWQAETTSSTDKVDFSKPTNNYLPKGTVDYCSPGVVSMGSVSMRTLRYGNNLYISSKGVKIIDVKKGTLPDHNTVGVANVNNTGRHTEITLDVLWKAPFRLDIAPQKYTSLGTEIVRGDYTIASSTFEYVDITFCYTTLVDGTVNISADDPVFSKAEWIKNEGDYTLRLHLKKKGVFYGWSAEYNEKGQLVFSFLNPATIKADSTNDYGYRLDNVVIVIDVGHGGNDVGATGSNKNFPEKVLNLLLAQKLKLQLESIGATVYMTRYDDTNPTSSERMQLLRTVKADFCIAIHRNSTDSSTPSAFNSYHFNAFSADAAKTIYSATEKADLYEKTKWSGTKWHYFYTCRQTDCPVVLTENGFMSNSEEYKKMIDDKFNDKCAVALTQGIVNYFASIQ